MDRAGGVIARVVTRLRSVLIRMRLGTRRAELERDLKDEILFHQEMLVRDALAEGLTPEAAHRVARRRFGNETYFREASRDAWGFVWLDEIVQDLRFALRSVSRNPALSGAVMLTLALVIGANTAVFTLVNELLLSRLPVPNADGLVKLARVAPDGGERSFSPALYELLREGRRRTLTHVAAWDQTRLNVKFTGEAQPADGWLVSGNFFEALGIGPAAGRLISLEDDRPGAPPVVVISHGFWQRQFGGDRSVIGQAIDLDGLPATVIGVLPPEFTLALGSPPAELWVPLALHGRLGLNDHFEYQGLGQLAPGATMEAAAAELSTVYRSVVADEIARRETSSARPPDFSLEAGRARTSGKVLKSGPRPPDARRVNTASTPDPKRALETARITVMSPEQNLGKPLGASLRPQLRILLVAGILVLVVVCANLANLLFAAGVTRQREVAVRLALGAGRARLIRLLLVESAVLALVGAVLGLFFAYGGSAALLKFLTSSQENFLVDFAPDVRILAFSAAITALAIAVFALAPALRSSRLDLHTALKAAPGAGGTRAVLRIGRSLVSVQVALSLVLLVTAGVLVRSVQKMAALDPGYERENVLSFLIFPTTLGYEGARELALYERLRERLDATPGVQRSTLHRRALRWAKAGCPPGDTRNEVPNPMPVGPNFFATLGIPLVTGREFTARDAAGSASVVVLGESLARRVFPEGSPLGKSVRVTSNPGYSATVVGVVRDVGYASEPGEGSGHVCRVYGPVLQAPAAALGQMFIKVRTLGDPFLMMAAVRRTVAAVDANLALRDFETLAQQERSSLYGREASLAALTSAFGALALAFATIGLVGILSYSVTSRRIELGLRLALGAPPRSVLLNVLREMLKLVSYGVLIGVVASFALVRLTGKFLYGVSPTDPISIAAAIAIMASFGALAVYVPARRAARVDPAIVLRLDG